MVHARAWLTPIASVLVATVYRTKNMQEDNISWMTKKIETV